MGRPSIVQNSSLALNLSAKLKCKNISLKCVEIMHAQQWQTNNILYYIVRSADFTLINYSYMQTRDNYMQQ